MAGVDPFSACEPDACLLWDSEWSPLNGFADWKIAGAGEAQNRGGLQATSAIATAVTLSLFTDKRVPADHPLAYLVDDGDPRGWWGDGVDVRADLGESELGSFLWLLERAPLTISGQPVSMWARQFALEALAPLQSQGVVVRIDADAVANEIANRLELTVALYGRDGSRLYDRKFDILWNQVAR
jgi:phage gp46-like protein